MKNEKQEDLKKKVYDTVQKYHLINQEDKILVGVSGGPDSISLLHILHELQYNICVAHMNHGLRENAKNDEEYVRNFCHENAIPCFVKRIDLKQKSSGMTLEEAGRKERYLFFEEILQQENCTKIATAHNKNDSVESIFMNMIRGSGLSGLKGILPIIRWEKNNDLKEICIIRPLIECSRQEIENYCEKMQLHPCHDESNDETIYTRNKIRLELIPYIEKNINSNIINNMERLSQLAIEEDAYISKQVIFAYEQCIISESDGKVICNLKVFRDFDIVIKKRLILKCIIKVLGNAKDIEKVHVEDILKLCDNNVGGKYLTPNKHIKVEVHHSKVEFTAT